MRTTAQLRRIWSPPCTAPTASREILPGIRITCDPRAVEAFQALGSVLQAHRYQVRASETGAYNCRLITGGRAHSLHAYGIAVDVNWNSNPYRVDNRLVTDMPPEMIEDVRRIRTVQERPVFRWGGDFVRVKDAMHFEIVATPTELSYGIDWNTVAQPVRDPARPLTWLVVHPGDRGPTVRELQARLGVAADGIYGPITRGAVEGYQREHGLSVDGVVGLQTWTALLTDQPPVAPGAPGPVKGANRVAAGAPGPEGAAGLEAAVEILGVPAGATTDGVHSVTLSRRLSLPRTRDAKCPDVGGGAHHGFPLSRE